MKLALTRVLCSAIFVFASIELLAQEDDFHTLHCHGPIPEDFTKLSVEKYKEDVSGMEARNARERKSKEKFYLESNYHVDALLNSGKVLFGDEVSLYVNQVADKALIADPSLRAKIRIYVIKSPVVNAFATNNGIIFISTGLLSQLDNEAQLAFVLCHEAIHVQKQHGINEHIERDEMVSGKGKYATIDKSDLFLLARKYSKELETEADLGGFDLFVKSNYDLNSALGIFDVLLYSDLPFDEVGFSASYFETEDYIFPDKYKYRGSLVIKERVEDENDEKSTHPNVKKRKLAITNQINKEGESYARVLYAVSQEQFEYCRKLCRYEICRELILDRQYQLAFYNAYMLEKQYPDSKYIQKVILKSLYGIAKYKVNGKFSEVNVYSADVEGFYASVAFFFNKIENKEMLILALRYAWNMKNKYPDDAEVNLMYADLMEIFAKAYTDISFFTTEPREKYFPKDTTANDTVAIDSSKIAPQKQELFLVDVAGAAPKPRKEYTLRGLDDEKDEEKEENPYYKFSLRDILMQEGSFKDDYALALEKNKESSRELTDAEVKQKKKERKINKHKGYALGIEKVVFADPFYTKIDIRHLSKRRYIVDEKMQSEFNSSIKKCAESIGLENIVLNPNTMSTDMVVDLNCHSLAMEWMAEKSDHAKEEYFVSPLHNEMKEFTARYNTPYLSYLGAINIASKRLYPGSVLFVTILFWPLLPYGIYYMVTPRHHTLYFSMLFNVVNDRLIMAELKKVKMGQSKAGVTSHMYYTTMQYRNERKPKK